MERQTIFREHIGSWYFLLPVVDILSTVGSALFAWWFLANFYYTEFAAAIPLQFYYAITLAAFILPSCFSWAGLYRAWRGQDIFSEVQRVLLAWALVFLILATLALLTQSGSAFSRMWMGTWFLMGLLTLSLGRLVVRYLLRTIRQQGYDQKNIVLVGTGQLSRTVIKHINSHPWTGLVVKGVFDNGETHQKSIQEVPVLGATDDLVGFLGESSEKIDQVWLAMPLSEERQMAGVIAQLRATGIDVCYVPDVFGMRMLNNEMINIAGLPVLNLTASPITGINRVVKEIEDKLLASMILLLISPVMIGIALAIKLTSPGPVLFRQIRHGWDGRQIEVYKFRSMLWENGDLAFKQATRSDSRITPLGRFLRSTSLDELPQFINVLQGRMSIVGPRPHAIEHNAIFEGQVDRYHLRHKVKPGITGWAQINGFRGETDTLYKMQKRIEHDLFYIENWSFTFDLKIVFLTLLRGFVDKGAY